jgi:hypothetical protein|nr:MAG TPA: hypothetical protein [Caudoviricetes sp.]
MASFLDKTGLTKFWELIKQYLNNNFITAEIYRREIPSIDHRIKYIYKDINYIDIPDTLEVSYNDYIKGYTFFGNDNISATILLKFYNKNLLLGNLSNSKPNIKLSNIAQILLIFGGVLRYLGRLPYSEIYINQAIPVYSEISFDIYLKKVQGYTGEYTYKLVLIPVYLSNSYTLNFIPGESMIRYLKGNTKLMGSNNFYKVDLVTDSPYDFTDSISPSSNNDTINLDRLIHLYNRHDIEYTIRYPRYLNGLLTFLKVDGNDNSIVLADKTPHVVDDTYNEVVLTKNTGLYMYGDIYSQSKNYLLPENLLSFNISSNQDTTDKLLSLSGDISTILNLLKIYEITMNIEVTNSLLYNLKIFHSPYIGSIDIGCINNFNIPFDPMMRYIMIYYNLFNNTGISTAISGIHLIGANSYIRDPYSPADFKSKVFNNYTYAYRNCKQLTKLIVYIYLEGDINLDSTLENDYIDRTWYSIRNMVYGSSKLNSVVIKPGVKGGLKPEDFTKFSKLIKPIADKLKLEKPTWNVEIHNSNI